MARSTLLELSLDNLRGVYTPINFEYMSKEEALDNLRTASGHDYGYDVEKWEKWLRMNPEEPLIKEGDPILDADLHDVLYEQRKQMRAHRMREQDGGHINGEKDEG